ncbi:MAG: DUF1016 family protein [Armatimonadetes bacterium]|nr:DUF1016 family protein [Armatimonadota bacterium]
MLSDPSPRNPGDAPERLRGEGEDSAVLSGTIYSPFPFREGGRGVRERSNRGPYLPCGPGNLILSALDDLVKHPEDRPSTGLILCASRNKAVAEYALRDLNKPIALADYILTRDLPEDLVRTLPDPRELERIITVGSDPLTRWGSESEEPQPTEEPPQTAPGTE